MTREETKEAIAVMQHYVDGGEVEFLHDTNDFWHPCVDYNWDWLNNDYRIKPIEEKKYWDCTEDVVIGAVFRHKGCTEILYPVKFGYDCFILSMSQGFKWSAISNFEYSLDGKTWKECLK